VCESVCVCVCVCVCACGVSICVCVCVCARARACVYRQNNAHASILVVVLATHLFRRPATRCTILDKWSEGEDDSNDNDATSRCETRTHLLQQCQRSVAPAMRDMGIRVWVVDCASEMCDCILV
jgi:hypothetical protein